METSNKLTNKQLLQKPAYYTDFNNIVNVKLEVIKNNRQQYIDEMLKMSTAKLDKNYALIVKQLKMAYDTDNFKAVDILFEMENQVLEALVQKM